MNTFKFTIVIAKDGDVILDFDQNAKQYGCSRQFLLSFPESMHQNYAAGWLVHALKNHSKVIHFHKATKRDWYVRGTWWGESNLDELTAVDDSFVQEFYPYIPSGFVIFKLD